VERIKEEDRYCNYVKDRYPYYEEDRFDEEWSVIA
jgi:hypothetical protein